MKNYSYQIFEGPRRYVILLTRLRDGVSRTYVMYGERSVENLHDHMRSLTDVCCDDLFPKDRGTK